VLITRTNTPDGVEAVMPLKQSTAGSSGSFLVLADDGRRYWCKGLNNFQDARVPANEQICARLGRLIGAPACEPQLVLMDAIVGWEIRPGSGVLVESGWAHGSLAVEPAIETHALEYRSEDDNAERHAGIHALCDWLAGTDVQWLTATLEDRAYYSHDHGHFLAGPAWTPASLAAIQNTPYALADPADQLDKEELDRLADALESVTRQDIEAELSKLPASWPVDDAELEALADFLDARRTPTASRLRALLP
jgi:hypothetical protein